MAELPKDPVEAAKILRRKIETVDRAARDERLTPETRQRAADAAKMGRMALELLKMRPTRGQ